MKNLATISIIRFLLSSCGNSQKKLTDLDPIVLKAKETSLYSQNVNWEKANIHFIELTKEQKKTVAELKEGLQYLINSLHLNLNLTKKGTQKKIPTR